MPATPPTNPSRDAAKEINNIRLYERLGYRPFRQEPVNENLTMIFLEKLVRISVV
jgi:hypothetical protein